MNKMHKKYIEDFEKLARDWEHLKRSPSKELLNIVKQDLEEIAYGLDHISF